MSQKYRSLLISQVAPAAAEVPLDAAEVSASSAHARACPATVHPPGGLLARRVAPAAFAVAGLAIGQAAQAQSTLPVPALLSGYNNFTAAGPGGTTGQNGTYVSASPLEASHYLFVQGSSEATGCNTYSNSCGYWGVSTCTTTYPRYANPAGPMTAGYNTSADGAVGGDQNAIWYNTQDTERLAGGGSGTLTLNHPEEVKHVYFFESTGSEGNNGTITAALHYTNGATATDVFNTDDWWSSNGTGSNAGGNAGGPYGAACNGWYVGAVAYVHEYEFDPGSSFYSLTLSSVGFTYGGTGYANIWGISTTAVTPTPPGVVLAVSGMGLSAVSMWGSRRKRRKQATPAPDASLPGASPPEETSSAGEPPGS